MITAFYQSAAQLCFTLLGLWWLVLQTKYHEWINDDDQRRLATAISFFFLLPGAMSLVALLGGGIPLIWRAAFVVASLVGAVGTMLSAFRSRSAGAAPISPRSRWMTVGLWLGVVLFAVVAIAAVSPIITFPGLMIKPEGSAAMGLALLATLGALLAWGFFLDRRRAEPAARPAAPTATTVP